MQSHITWKAAETEQMNRIMAILPDQQMKTGSKTLLVFSLLQI